MGGQFLNLSLLNTIFFCRLALPQKEEERVLRDNIEEEDKKETQGIRLTERIDEVTDIIRQIA